MHRPSPPSLSQDSDQSLTQRWQRHRQPAPSRPDPLHSPASPSWTNRDQQAGPLEAPEAAEQQQQAVPAAGQGCSGSDWSEDSAGAAMHRSQEDLEAAEQGRPGPGSHSAAQQADARATRELKPNRASEGNWAAPAWESSSSSVELPEAAQNSTHRSTASTLELPGAAQALGQEFSAASSLDPWQAAQNVDPDSAQMQSSWSSRPPEARPPLLSSSSERSLFTAEQQAAGAEQERSASEMQDEPEQQGSNSRPSSRRSSRPEMPRSRTPSSEHEWRHPAQGKAEQAQRHQLSEGTSEASWSQPVARAGQAEAELSEASSGQLPPRAAQGAEQVSEHSWGQLSPRAARGAEQVSEDSWGQLSPRATREGPQAPPVHPPTAAPSEQLRKPSNAAPQNPAEQAAVQPEPGSTPAPEGKRRMGYWWTPGVDDAEPSELRQPKSTPGECTWLLHNLRLVKGGPDLDRTKACSACPDGEVCMQGQQGLTCSTEAGVTLSMLHLPAHRPLEAAAELWRMSNKARSPRVCHSRSSPMQRGNLQTRQLALPQRQPQAGHRHWTSSWAVPPCLESQRSRSSGQPPQGRCSWMPCPGPDRNTMRTSCACRRMWQPGSRSTLMCTDQLLRIWHVHKVDFIINQISLSTAVYVPGFWPYLAFQIADRLNTTAQSP